MATKLLDHIELNPRVCNGKPVIRGTRVPVTVLLDLMAEGETWDQILTGYPALTAEHLRAALLYAKASLENADVELLAA
ncbi:MAG: DUF433 domain-containing protein [Candidatus Riflebacteria bacterium]|nr:DUF433 domain-containing protein [Candidatus Riflebacteria bacterium]